MPQQPPVHDETVRMRPEDTDGRPSPDGTRPGPDSSRPAPDEGPPAQVDDHDDTRPVTRDWLLGAPEQDATTTGAAPHDPADGGDRTQTLGRSDALPPGGRGTRSR
ncbi:hypothetical protein [Blastococcus brunescens]|uniref:Uncharacterized protein n=1 Tax=Blastococcus brunescens TaxID=1564165 RepID=A0ABZ1AVQ2_9ACTN|nr:hypothetical protein [Blastococcus sp. BMG 8361]WRL62016.1 hypothetical protein U6N30_18255 [Blastococcus sp. BMG 8361]